MPPAFLAHLKRMASEKKWPEARSWCERRQVNKGYALWAKGKPDTAPGRRRERPRVSTSSCPSKPSPALEEHEERTGRQLLVVKPGERQWYSPNERSPLQALLQVARPTGRGVGEGQGGGEEGEAEVARGDLLADDRCSPAVLDFAHVGRTAPPVEGKLG